MIFKPMLSATLKDTTKIRYPVLVSPKLDGIRCLMLYDHDNVTRPFSRKLLPIPNKYINRCLAGLPAFDGELIVGEPTGSDCINRASSGVMSVEGTPDFTYHVFDVLRVDHIPF